MQRKIRAAALAAGAFTLCAAVGFAGPLGAAESSAGPVVSYAAHASTALTVGNLGLNDLRDGRHFAHDVDFSTPVATHAIAPAFSDPTPATAEPGQRDGRSLAELVDDYAASETPDEETDCLARAVYYESKGEPLTGQLTVAEVILNRADSGRFPSTLCGVVRQRGQFSFVHGGHIPQPPQGSRDWRTAVAIAQIAVNDLADGGAPDALFFHARYAHPGWRLTRIATVGNHIFYR